MVEFNSKIGMMKAIFVPGPPLSAGGQQASSVHFVVLRGLACPAFPQESSESSDPSLRLCMENEFNRLSPYFLMSVIQSAAFKDVVDAL